MKKYILLYGVLLYGLICGSIAAPPNLVVLLSDDLGRLDTSVYGSPDVRTPTLDSLAEQGMTFENAYVASPSCCPNRASLLTGLMPARHGAHPNHSHMKSGTKELTGVLKEMGYQIASLGKVKHRRAKFDGCDFLYQDPENMSRDLQKLIDSGELEDGPVCFFVGDRRPHVPWIEEMIYDPEKVILPSNFIDTLETREHWARYLSDITHMDAEMGRALDIVRKQFGEDFICLFTSDHGRQWPFGKWNLYDSGTRVPLIVTWPGQIKAGVRSDAFVSWVDLIPTLVDLAGGTVPYDIDGKSFAKVLMGETQSHSDKIFTTHTGDTIYNIYPIRSVRVGNWKFIHNLRPDAIHTNHSDILRKPRSGGYWASWDAAAATDFRAAAIIKSYYTRPEFELFNLDDDLLEQQNLASENKYQSKLEEFQNVLSGWAINQGDDLKAHREPYLHTGDLEKIRANVIKQRNRR